MSELIDALTADLEDGCGAYIKPIGETCYDHGDGDAYFCEPCQLRFQAAEELEAANQTADRLLSVIERDKADAERLGAVQRAVDDQAEDEGLWFQAKTAAEAYLQQELRNLHRAIEGESNNGSGDSTADVVLHDRSNSQRPPNPIYDYREDPGWPAQ